MMFVRTSMGSESQDDATKITFALADSRIYSFMKMVTLYMSNLLQEPLSQCLTLLFLPVS